MHHTLHMNSIHQFTAKHTHANSVCNEFSEEILESGLFFIEERTVIALIPVHIR